MFSQGFGHIVPVVPYFSLLLSKKRKNKDRAHRGHSYAGYGGYAEGIGRSELGHRFWDRLLGQQFSETKNVICESCGNQNFWRSIFGGEFCWGCFPPVDFSLVQNPDSDFPKGGDSSGFEISSPGWNPKNGNPDFGNLESGNSEIRKSENRKPEIEIQDLQFLPRGILWPPEVLSLWLDSQPTEPLPDWLETKTDILYRIDRRTIGRGANSKIEETRIPMMWFRPSWAHPSFPCPTMPQPNLVSRWRPNDLPCCWWCGLSLFWLDASGDERCAMCSPVPWEDWSQVVKWIRKPGVESLDSELQSSCGEAHTETISLPVGNSALIDPPALV